jgi:hypothetical protein
MRALITDAPFRSLCGYAVKGPGIPHHVTQRAMAARGRFLGKRTTPSTKTSASIAARLVPIRIDRLCRAFFA